LSISESQCSFNEEIKEEDEDSDTKSQLENHINPPILQVIPTEKQKVRSNLKSSKPNSVFGDYFKRQSTLFPLRNQIRK